MLRRADEGEHIKEARLHGMQQGPVYGHGDTLTAVTSIVAL